MQILLTPRSAHEVARSRLWTIIRHGSRGRRRRRIELVSDPLGPAPIMGEAERSGSTVESDKTAIIHLARMAERSSQGTFTIKGETIQPQEIIKVLGIIMNLARLCLRYSHDPFWTVS